MLKVNGLFDDANVKKIQEKGPVSVYEYQYDMSVNPAEAVTAYFAAKMNIKKRQVLINMQDNAFTLSAGAMQWMAGNINLTSGVKGVGDLVGKAFASKVTKEGAIKPEYKGTGLLMLEPTYKHIILMDVAEWGSVVIEDGLFLACESSLKQKVVARSNLSSAVLGGEGLFNMSLQGDGILILESPVPESELIVVELNNDTLKIDGNMAIAWSSSLDFTVEKSGRSIMGSAVSGEGLVNVFRGTGKVLMAPIRYGHYNMMGTSAIK